MADHPDFRLNDFIPYLLSQAAEAIGQQFAAIYRDRYGMLNTEWRVLAHLGEAGGLTAKQIGAQARVHKTKVSRAVVALERKRFVARTTSDTDRRSATLELTKTGRKVYEDLAVIAREYDRQLAHSLGQKGREDLVTQLRQLSSRRT
ncbi:MarR family transcriptional regulator [Pseudohoeflea suaedae]|uniref:MarR family transcriptional regulator n=1 Tax=Pseudohoeflea suaedae TaxID=877384 RepID=A0A4V6PK03_9HYPH|nr:MarR family transcriptional regulator [Pseudohoeflea suaedae]TDH35208.1 MarR family transcriptional regulator [Pseudohoeflea suaedae]